MATVETLLNPAKFMEEELTSKLRDYKLPRH